MIVTWLLLSYSSSSSSVYHDVPPNLVGKQGYSSQISPVTSTFGDSSMYPPQITTPVYDDTAYQRMSKSMRLLQQHYMCDNQPTFSPFEMHTNAAYGAQPMQYIEDPQIPPKSSAPYESHQEVYGHGSPHYQEPPQAHQCPLNVPFEKYGTRVMEQNSQSVVDNYQEDHAWPNQGDQLHCNAPSSEDQKYQQHLLLKKQQIQLQPKVQQKQSLIPTQRMKQHVLQQHPQQSMQPLPPSAQVQEKKPNQQYQGNSHQLQQSTRQDRVYSSQQVYGQELDKPARASSYQSQSRENQQHQIINHRQDIMRKSCYASNESVHQQGSLEQAVDRQNTQSKLPSLKHPLSEPQQQQSIQPNLLFRGQNNQLSFPLIYDFITSAETQVCAISYDWLCY